MPYSLHLSHDLTEIFDSINRIVERPLKPFKLVERGRVKNCIYPLKTPLNVRMSLSAGEPLHVVERLSAELSGYFYYNHEIHYIRLYSTWCRTPSNFVVVFGARGKSYKF